MSRIFMPDVGVQEVIAAELDLMVWPNPGTDLLHVRQQGVNGLSFRLTDIYGKVFMASSSPTIITTLDTSAMPSGVYLLQVRDVNGKHQTLMWVKQ